LTETDSVSDQQSITIRKERILGACLPFQREGFFSFSCFMEKHRKEVFMDAKELYRQKLDAQLKEWNAKVNLLAAKVENATADAKIRYARQLDEIKAKQTEIKEKLTELENAGSGAWESVKTKTDSVLEDLKTKISQALSNMH